MGTLTGNGSTCSKRARDDYPTDSERLSSKALPDIVKGKKLSQAIVNILENSQAKVRCCQCKPTKVKIRCQCNPAKVIFKNFWDNLL